MGNNRLRKGSSRSGLGLSARSSTESFGRLKKSEREEIRLWLPIYDEFSDSRPKTRGDCVNEPRPCPWIGCRYNNYIDVKESGSIVKNFPDKEPEDIPPERSCSLDIADSKGASLEDVGRVLNMTRERVRQIQGTALHKLSIDPILSEHLDKPGSIHARIATNASQFGEWSGNEASSESNEEVEEDKSEDDLSLLDGDAIGFLSTHPKADQLVTARIWRIYKRMTDARHNENDGHRDNADDRRRE